MLSMTSVAVCIPFFVPYSVQLDVDSHVLTTGDPILYKVTLRNNSRSPLACDYDIGFELGNLKLQIKDTGPRDFRNIEPYAVCGPQHFGQLMPRTQLATYDSLYQIPAKDTTKLFPNVGRFEIRAGVITGQGVIWSPVVCIQSLPRNAESTHALIEASPNLKLAATAIYKVDNSCHTTLLRSRSALRSSNAGVLISRLCAAAALRDAISSNERAQSINNIARLRPRLSPLARDFFDLQVASAYLDRGEQTEALRVLLRCDPSTSQFKHLRQSVLTTHR